MRSLRDLACLGRCSSLSWLFLAFKHHRHRRTRLYYGTCDWPSPWFSVHITPYHTLLDWSLAFQVALELHLPAQIRRLNRSRSFIFSVHSAAVKVGKLDRGVHRRSSVAVGCCSCWSSVSSCWNLYRDIPHHWNHPSLLRRWLSFCSSASRWSRMLRQQE